jgi:hypothetical protein
MAIHAFQSEDGCRIEVELAPAELMDLPLDGRRLYIERDGVRYRRVHVSDRMPGEPISVQISADVANVVHKYPYASNVLPRRLAGCQCDQRGRPIIQNRQHEREVCASHSYTRE